MYSSLPVIFAPWRYQYIKQAVSSGHDKCVFCTIQGKSDDEALILVRGKYSYVVMNLYPYNTGHVMIIPYRHVGSLEDLNDDELLEMMKLVNISLKALRHALKPHGFNIGVNLGRVAGAGIEDHVHIHVVPRWNGDTNFMPVIGGVKIIPQDVKETYRMIKPFFEKYWREAAAERQPP